MSPLQRVRKPLGILGLVIAFPFLVSAQSDSGYITNGVEYAPAGNLPGDQMNPSVGVNSSGGYIVWQDNITDGSGYGISAVRLDSTYSPVLSPFRINVQGADDQEKPQVTLLKGGGAAIIWQGGKLSLQHIYASFLSSSNTFTAQDVPVNTSTNFQKDAVIATLNNSNVVVAWASRGQDNADGMQGIYARLLMPTGTNVTGEIAVNQFTPWNQRTPAVAALANGNFVIAWVSEQERFVNSIDIYARLYNSAGAPLGGEMLVNNATNPCANPAIVGAPDGTFVIAWSQKDLQVSDNSWDVFVRRFTADGAASPTIQRLNTQRYGDQFAPKLAVSGTDMLAIWTSLGQDGSREGVFGQFFHDDLTLSLAGGEFAVNTTVLNQQIYPTLASDGMGRFLAVWSSYLGGFNGLDLNAQRYATYLDPLSPPAPPVVSAISDYALSVAWSPLVGLNVDHWELYVDAGNTVLTTNTYWQNTSLQAPPSDADFDTASSHNFQLAYVLADGRHSPLSSVASGKTWGTDRNNDGLPDDWQISIWGTNKTSWLGANAVLAPDGTTVLMVFHWGGNPLDKSTWLKIRIDRSPQGWFLAWNTHPGSIYQVQISTDLHSWANLGGPRFAAGAIDSVYLGLANKAYYRITRLVY